MFIIFTLSSCFPDLKVAMVSDLMQLTPLPKVVCVLKSWKGDDDKSSVVENEVLIVKQVSRLILGPVF